MRAKEPQSFQTATSLDYIHSIPLHPLHPLHSLHPPPLFRFELTGYSNQFSSDL